MNRAEEREKKPPSAVPDSQGNSSVGRHTGVSVSDVCWLPVWRGGAIAGLALHSYPCPDRLWQHKALDMGNGKLE